MPDTILMFGDPSRKPQILSSIRSPSGNEDEDGLFIEKELIKKVMAEIEGDEDFCFIPEICRTKNTKDSVDYRKKGNEMFVTLPHNRLIHQKIWKLYSQSIALAPDNSEELALAYNNRSVLLFHMRKYKESVIDCDRALQLTASDLTKARLLSRKAIALLTLETEAMKEVSEEMLNSVEQLSLDDELKNKYVTKIKDYLNNIHNVYNSNSNSDPENAFDKFPHFTCQTEAPCASEAIAIKYDEYWGRHIIANRDIEPGEILAVEECYHTFIYPDGMYTHCSNCAKATWNNMPCKYCIYDVYCSENCRCEAWTKYHQFECNVYLHLWDIDEDIKHCPTSIRFTLLSVFKAGGIKQLQNEFISMKQCTDSRTKGFSTDGVFDSNTSRSANSLSYDKNLLDKQLTPTLAKMACNGVYFLATKSNFFGKRFDESPTQILLNQDVLFIGALILRNLIMLQNVVFTYDEYFEDFHQRSIYGVSVFPFCSFFNHSCDSNANFFTSKNNELVIFAKKSIKKNSQVFLSYYGQTFLYKNKEDRMKIYKQLNFTCQCIACAQNWSHICLPRIQDLLQSSPQEVNKINNMIDESYAFKVDENDDKTFYIDNVMKEVVNILQTIAEKVTENCAEYEFFTEYMRRMYVKSFGNWFEVPHQC